MIKVNFHTSLLLFKVPAKYLHFNVQNVCASNDILRCYEHFRNVIKIDNQLIVIRKCTCVPFQMISLSNSHTDTTVLILSSLEYRSKHSFYQIVSTIFQVDKIDLSTKSRRSFVPYKNGPKFKLVNVMI